jgi:hypothetical protein
MDWMLDPRFLDRAASHEVRLPSGPIELPILYREASAIAGIFAIDAAPASAALPGRLSPVRLTRRRGVLVVWCFDYQDTSIGPYGEVAIGILASARPLPPLLGVLGERRLTGVALYIRHLPVTTSIALEAGQRLWGYPKFLADIRFADGDLRRTCELSEGGRSILSFTAPEAGRATEESRPYRTYSMREGKLLRTSFLTQSRVRVSHLGQAARLELGDHPIAREIASWCPSARPLETRFVEHMQSILPPADWVSPAVGAAS